MVTPSCFPPSEAKRYTGRGIPSYHMPLYADRRTSPYNSHDSRISAMNERDISEEVSGHRKRIAVACGRCRKRKIRCSGDNGSGQPCTNCKNAGHDPCQFLRVSSQETPMKGESGFTYTVDLSRQFQSRGPAVISPLPSSMSPYPEAIALPGTETMPYKTNNAYAYNNKQCCTIPGWTGGYSDDHAVDYSIYQSAYQTVQEPHPYMMNAYRLPSNAQSTKANVPLYVDNESEYGYTSVPTTTALVHRPATNVDTSTFPLQHAVESLPSSTDSHERVLPVPPTRTLPISGPPTYRHDSLSSGYSKISQTQSHSSSGAGSPPSSLVDGAANYNNFESSHLSPYSDMKVAAQLGRSNDLYSTTSSDAVTDHSMRASTSAPDMTYRYIDTTRHVSNHLHNPTGIILDRNHTYIAPPHERQSVYGVGNDLNAGSSGDGSHKSASSLRA